MSSEVLLRRGQAALLVIDVQERLAAVMEERHTVVQAIATLIKGCQQLGVPVLYAEQYPKGLGPTVLELRELLLPAEPLTKLYFSCCKGTDLLSRLKERQVTQVVVVGMEAHICVLQTALDLLAEGFAVHVVSEGVTSRKLLDKQVALARLHARGAQVTTVEAVLYELVERSDAAEFRAIRSLIR
ncbi:MAG: isochorismatase family protein [candidate division KSB1 bacterium]|nr:isochorismatase family protein [candidate division KSB1 bacterium]MDZ7294964.1 isochorismatase family protein [candidate division KSB1 bacterium]MDZ7378385.1 isochorismatase family protein [candidate division KSB1 bacterium]MDZ7412214.1 isochorismatase family protein [candidate division KSB1 bacterium]